MKLIKLIVEKNNKSAKGRLGVLSGFKNLDINAQHYEAIGKAQLLKEVQELEAEGLIKAKWYDGKSELISIRYSMEILPLLYERLGTKHPKFELAEYQRRVQTGYERLRKEWLKKYYDKMLSQLADGTIPHELREEKLLLCMEALDQLEEPIYKKVFSKHYLNDSKVFEKSLEKSVISAAKEHYKEVIDDNMSKSQILSQLFIEEYSQTLYIKGELMIYIAGELIDLAKHIYGIMLNSQTLKHAEIASAQRIKKIVTIENQANFEYQQFEKGVLYIYTHGYFSPKEKVFLKKLLSVLENIHVAYFHSGDIDFGGVRIYQYTKKIFPDLKPLCMDLETYLNYRKNGYQMEASAVDKLREIEEPDLKEVIDIMVKEGIGIEQESFLH